MTLDTGASEPSACLTWTVTVFEVMSFDCPSTMYLRGLVGSSFSWNSVKCSALSTVWLQATSLLKPMLMKGKPESEPPITSIWPGTVTWNWKKRSVPAHGKCGLPSSMPLPLSVASEPSARALLPSISRRAW